MKKFLFLLLLIFSSGNLVAQENEPGEIDKNQLLKFIEKAKSNGQVGANPILVLDEQKVVNLEELPKDQRFSGRILFIEEGNEEMQEIYGKGANDGVIMINSVSKVVGEGQKQAEEKILYFLKGKEVSQKYLQKINPDSVKSVKVFKSKEQIARYTSKECDGIVVIDAQIRN